MYSPLKCSAPSNGGTSFTLWKYGIGPFLYGLPTCCLSHAVAYIQQLLLQRSGDVTPLLHAMRIGQSHRDVAIILLGAFSRYINHLQDEDIPKPQTKTILRALRTIVSLGQSQ